MFLVGHLRSIFDKFKEVITLSQNEFSTNSALLARIMARRKNSFQKMKGFKSVCKLSSALCRLLRNDVQQLITDFTSTLPDLETISLKSIVQIPLRSNFEYVLLRIIGSYKIYGRIINCCMESAKYFSQLLQTHFFADISTLLLAIVAKIWKQSHLTAKILTDLFNNLIKFRNNFPEKECSQCLYTLPRRLKHISTQKLQLHANKSSVTEKVPLDIKCFSVIKKKAKTVDIGMVVDRQTLKPVSNRN